MSVNHLNKIDLSAEIAQQIIHVLLKVDHVDNYICCLHMYPIKNIALLNSSFANEISKTVNIYTV